MARKKVDEPKIKVGKITDVNGEVNIATGDIYKGFTAEQVSVLVTQITTTFQPKKFDGRCPYKGLDVFEEEDAELFFGREKLVTDLVSRVKDSRTVFVTGPSGSGKSSLVRAGLIHSLKQGVIKNSERWLYATMKPGRDPLGELARVTAGLAGSTNAEDEVRAKALTDATIFARWCEIALKEGQDKRAVLFIDQFEEVFTQISKDGERVAFLNLLTHAATVENGRVIILFSMRSDFVSNCATYPQLNELLNQQFVQIGAMQPEELVSAIAQPALRVGLRIDPDLIAQIINDMKGEPGALPLMQFALMDLFAAEQTKGGIIALTLNEYLQRGGIQKSLERHADAAFAKLESNEQEMARAIFSGLIEIGRGTQDTRRTAIFDDLIPATEKADEVQAIVRRLADARLITTDEIDGKDTVTISHEKLIDAWPWLKKLVNENRDVIALQNEITEDATEWDKHHRDTSYLYTGGRLINIKEKLTAQKLVLSGNALEFVNTGIKKQLRTRISLVTGVIVVIVALVTATLVFQKQKTIAEANAQLALENALMAEGNARETAAQARVSLARQLAAQATFIQNDKRDLALLLSAEAYTLDNNFETRGSMLSALQCCSDALISFLPGHTDSVWDVAFSPNGKILASGGNDGSIIIWDAITHQKIRHLIGHDSTATIYALAFDPTGTFLAAGDGTGTITFFKTQDWEKIPLIMRGHSSSILSLKFSEDGKLLVSGGTDGKVVVWDGINYAPIKTFNGSKSWIWDVAISADNNTIAAVGRERILRLWDLRPNTPVPSIDVEASSLVSATFNNDIKSPLLLTGDTNGKVIIWDLRPWQTNHEKPLPSASLATGPGATTPVWGLTFIPGDNFAFVTGRDNGILNRNRIILNDDFSKTFLQRETLGMTGNNIGVFRIDVSPDGKIIAAAGQDGLVSLWNATEMTSVIRHSAKVTNLQIANNDIHTAISLGNDGSLQRWDYSKQRITSKLNLDTEAILQSAISPDGTKVITGYEDGTLILWDGKNGKKLITSSKHLASITSLTFSFDSKHAASSDEQGNVILWDLSTGNNFKPSASFTDPQKSAIQVLLFSQDGSTLIGGGCGNPIMFPAPDCSQGAIYVWDIHPKLELRYEPLPGKAGFIWSMALNPINADELAVGTRDGTITIWDLKNRTTRLSFRLGKSDITALAFSLDGALLAVGADTYKVFIYNALTGQVFGQAFREHDGSVITLAFTPDGKSMLSASIDNTIVVHNINLADWLIHACRVANRNLTLDEWKQYIGDALPYQAVCPNLPIEAESTPVP